MHVFFSFLQSIQQIIISVGPFILLLGVLVFIHELGHFLAARYFGVTVEVFSLGFGPKILQYKKNTTIYCLSLIPLGGYVKMYGDNPLQEVPDSKKSTGFLYKKPWQKWIIAFAGPFMNLIFTLFAFFVLALAGLNKLPAQLGDVLVSSQAYNFGLRSGDTLLSINNQNVSYLEDIQDILKKHPNSQLKFKVQQEFYPRKIKNISVTTRVKKNTNPLSLDLQKVYVDGLNYSSTGLKVAVLSGSLSDKAGLKSFDHILKVDGKDIKYWRQLEYRLKNSNSKSLSLKIIRDKKELAIVLKKEAGLNTKSLGLEPTFLYIDRIGPKTPASFVDLKKGDRLVSINQTLLKTWDQILKIINSYDGVTDFFIRVQRQKKQHDVMLKPKKIFVEGNLKPRFMLGIASAGYSVFADPIKQKQSIYQATTYAFTQTSQWLKTISIGLLRFIQGSISIRNMGGPISIGRVAHASFQQGWLSFLFMMAIISLNLFFLNLLPIPMLDGGHLLFFTIEACLGRPLDTKKLLIAQQVGLVFLLSLIGFTLINDVYNWLKLW